MMGFGWGMGVGGWIAMTVFWIGLIVLIVWLVTRAFPRGENRGRDYRDNVPGRDEAPEQTLDRRFAAGEIDEKQYRTMRETLRSSGSSHLGER